MKKRSALFIPDTIRRQYLKTGIIFTVHKKTLTWYTSGEDFLRCTYSWALQSRVRQCQGEHHQQQQNISGF